MIKELKEFKSKPCVLFDNELVIYFLFDNGNTLLRYGVFNDVEIISMIRGGQVANCTIDEPLINVEDIIPCRNVELDYIKRRKRIMKRKEEKEGKQKEGKQKKTKSKDIEIVISDEIGNTMKFYSRKEIGNYLSVSKTAVARLCNNVQTLKGYHVVSVKKKNGITYFT